MRALVTDATGLIGSRIVKRLMPLRWDVLGLTDTKAESPEGVAFRAWPKRAGAFGKALDGVDVVFATDLAVAEGAEAAAKRLDGLIKAAAKAGVRRFVLVSSAELYGIDALGAGFVPETAPVVEPGEAGSALARAAFALEAALHAAPASMEKVVLRPLTVFSREVPDLVEIARKAVDGGEAPWPLPVLHGVDAGDLADAMVAAARTPLAAGHAFNIAAPEAVHSEHAGYEITRLGELLTDLAQSEVRIRPAYPQVAPLLDIGKAAQMLHVRPRKLIWVSLAELVQEVVRQKREAGEAEPVTPRMSKALYALETGQKPLAGKVAVVTGATSGIGRATALRLSQLGATVVAVGRNTDAGAALMAEMEARSTCAPGVFLPADLTSMSEVRRLAGELTARFPKIDILVNNAGAIYRERELSADGIEMSLALNLLAPFLLTQLLAGLLAAAEGARILNVSDDAHRDVAIDPDDLQGTGYYQPGEAYARAKAGMVMLSYCLDEKLAGSGVTVNLWSPSPARTPLGEFGLPEVDKSLGPQLQQRQQTQRDRARAQLHSPDHAAMPLVNLAMSDEFEAASGHYFSVDDKAESGATTYDPARAYALWEACARLTGLVAASPRETA